MAAEQASALGRVRDEYEAQLSRLHKLSEETWAALRAHADQRTEEQAMEHAAEVERLERAKEAIKEERTSGWAHLPLPEMLRHAMDEALAKLHEAHAQQLGALKAEHTAALERAEREVKEVREQAEAQVAKQQELSAGEVVRARQQARLEHEQARAQALEELNAQTGAEVQQLRDEQAHLPIPPYTSLHLPYISPTSPLDLACISRDEQAHLPRSPYTSLHLPYISP